MSGDNPLSGTWKLKSYVVTTAAGERSTPYGDTPKGYLTYSADHRMQVIGVATDRGTSAGASPPDSERVRLYDTLFAYAGTYSVQGDEVTHQVDVSWNEAWTGTDQSRHWEVRGNTLILTTCIPDPDSGAEAIYTVVWEKV